MTLPHLWSHLSGEWETVPAMELRGKRLAVDGQVWLYESWKETVEGGSKSFLVGFHNRCKALLDLDIEPIILFDQYQSRALPKVTASQLIHSKTEFCWVRDGRPVKVKEGARMKYGRNSMRLCNVKRVMDVLEAMGIRYFKSTAVDNEAAGSYLEDKGEVVGFVSPDLDYFLFGGQNLYMLNFEKNGTVLNKPFRRMRADSLLENHGLNRSRLVALGMLLGCDYADKKINGVGIVSALEIVAEFSMCEDDHPCTILERFRTYCEKKDVDRGKVEEDKDSLRKKKLRLQCFYFGNFNPSGDAMAEAVDAYMWPSLEHLPVSLLSRVCPNKQRVKELLALKMDDLDGDVSDSSVEILDDDTQSSRSSCRKRKSSSVESRRGRPRTTPILLPCSQTEAMAWSKREWQAILALKSATTAAFNCELVQWNPPPPLKRRCGAVKAK